MPGSLGWGSSLQSISSARKPSYQERQVLILQAKVSETSPFPRDKDATLSEESLRGLGYPGNCVTLRFPRWSRRGRVYTKCSHSDCAWIAVGGHPTRQSFRGRRSKLAAVLPGLEVVLRMSEVVIYAGVRKGFFFLKKRTRLFTYSSLLSERFGQFHALRNLHVCTKIPARGWDASTPATPPSSLGARLQSSC